MSALTLAQRARAAAGTALAVLPLSSASLAEAASLLPDYSLAAEYTNSGWFMGGFDDGAASAATFNDGVTLSGDKTVSDSLFWRYDDYYGATVRRADVTGFAFGWGGAVDGAMRGGDLVTADFSFELDFTHTTPTYPAYDYTHASWELNVGFIGHPYTPEPYQNTPSTLSPLTSASAYGSVDAAGVYTWNDSISLMIDDWYAADAGHWYAVLTVYWPDPLARSGYEDTQGAHNGDTLRLTVPDGGIRLGITPSSSTLAGETVVNTSLYVLPSSSMLRTAGTFRNAAGAEARIEGDADISEGGLMENLGLLRAMGGSRFNNYGGMTNGASATMELDGDVYVGNSGQLVNEGLLRAMGGSRITNDGRIENRSGATLEQHGGIEVGNGGALVNEGLLRAMGGASFNSYGRTENRSGATFESYGMTAVGNDGTLVNEGLLRAMGGASMSNYGNIENRAGATLSTAVGSNLDNYGRFDNDGHVDNMGTLLNAMGGSMHNRGTMTNSSPDTLINDGFMVVEGVLTNTATGVAHNNGDLEIADGGALVNDGLLNNDGYIDNQGAVTVGVTGIIRGSGAYAQSAGSTRVDGLLDVAELDFAGGLLTGDGVLTSAGGVLIGSGTMLAPSGVGGARSGRLDVVGDFTLADGAALSIDLDGTLAGSSYDWLAIDGSATLAGDLFLDFAFTPLAGQVFTFLTASNGISGRFGHVHADGWDVSLSYGDNAVSLTLAAAPVPEADSWALLLAGLGLIGWRARRRA
jgi:hypothetical protein